MKVEKFVKYSTTVMSLPEAWEFVMAHVDEVGPSPSVHIEPFWQYTDGAPTTRKYSVSVSGVVEGGPTDGWEELT